MMKKNEYFHVYVLVSASRANFVKVGKSNNTNRVRHLIRMEYAGIADWCHAASFRVHSNHGALALENMINTRLTDLQFKRPRIEWVNALNSRVSYADECFHCNVEEAITVSGQMADVYFNHVCMDSTSALERSNFSKS